MSDVFREVDEEVRRDKAAEFWKKHGNKLIAATVLVIAGVAGWQFWQNQQARAKAAAGARFEAAVADLATSKPDATAALTALAGDKAGGNYAALARLRLAGELASKAGDDAARANAVSAYDALANDTALPAEWREIARLRAGLVLVDHAPLPEVETRLMPMISGTGTFRNAAREGIALAAYRTGQFDKALDALQAIILDADAPAALRQRAEILLAVVRSGPTTKP
jgi:hypothetical protein